MKIQLGRQHPVAREEAEPKNKLDLYRSPRLRLRPSQLLVDHGSSVWNPRQNDLAAHIGIDKV
ncbi:hypothetical protein GCM10009679_32580 [Saccharothrix algeriensis]|uniref:Uncharacterized protein n=1 Tax=Catellatospora bangladeshensis TaxID=310355 RepID=A0A8J3NIW4_9ACTN|nr:hypothetical protein Cba03nite_21800 [Catellatospora bangladeshensis]